MVRDLNALVSRRFDVLVVGGGIHGLMAAWDAATRGLDVALIERQDFGSGASFNHHRTLHGGLRYLQTGNLARLRESVRERRVWARIAPQFLARQAFAIRVGGDRGKSPRLLQAGLAADALLAADRNQGVEPSLRLPPGALVAAATRGAVDTGALLDDGPIAVWYDYRTEHAERLTLGVALAASAAGAVLANYVDGLEPIRDGKAVRGVLARDGVGGERFPINARVTIDATGAAAGRLAAGAGVRQTPLLVKAMNLVTRRPAPSVACGSPTASGRLLFALPCQGQLSIGTWHGTSICGADAGRVTLEDVSAFVAEINEAFPALRLTLDDVTFVQRGVVPARVSGDEVDLADRPVVRNHRRDQVDGLVTLRGVKYTTARAVAQHAVSEAVSQLGKAATASGTARTALAGAMPDASVGSPIHALDAEAWAHLQRVYGGDAGRVASRAAGRPELAARLVPHLPVTGIQVVEAVRHEMATTLDDVLLRRLGVGAAGYPGDDVARVAAGIMRTELGWTDAQVDEEIALLAESYLPLRVGSLAVTTPDRA